MEEKPKGRVLRGVVLALAIGLPIVFFLAACVFWFLLDSPYGIPEGKSVQILVSRGMNFEEVADELERTGLIGSARYIQWRYRIAARMGWVPPHQAGRYVLQPGNKPSEIITSLTMPVGSQRVYTTVTIPPGSTASRIAGIVEESGLARSEDVRYFIRNAADDYPIVRNPEGLQGYLFPDTYMIETPLDQGTISSRTAAEEIVRLMADGFFDVLDEIDKTWRMLTPGQLHEKVILASIVEREYRVSREASLIASVFNNRLHEKMALQSCATVVYTIEETAAGEPFREDYWRFNRRIFERYLEIDSAYNTYRYPILPPGPISSPGKIALEAAFFPAKSDALFFVVKNPDEGTHVFTRDYADHLNARSLYLNQFVVKD